MAISEDHDRNIYNECFTYRQAKLVNLFGDVPSEYTETLDWFMNRHQDERDWDNPQEFQIEVDMIFMPLGEDEELWRQYKLRFERHNGTGGHGEENYITFEKILKYRCYSEMWYFLYEHFDEVRQGEDGDMLDAVGFVDNPLEYDDEEDDEEDEEEDDEEDDEGLWRQEDPISVIYTNYIYNV